MMCLIFSWRCNALQCLDRFLGVVRVRVLHAPLVTSLRPATHFDALHLLPFHLLGFERFAQAEHEDARRVCVGQQRRVSRVRIVQAGEMVQVRLIVHVQIVVLERRIQLDRLK